MDGRPRVVAELAPRGFRANRTSNHYPIESTPFRKFYGEDRASDASLLAISPGVASKAAGRCDSDEAGTVEGAHGQSFCGFAPALSKDRFKARF